VGKKKGEGYRSEPQGKREIVQINCKIRHMLYINLTWGIEGVGCNPLNLSPSSARSAICYFAFQITIAANKLSAIYLSGGG